MSEDPQPARGPGAATDYQGKREVVVFVLLPAILAVALWAWQPWRGYSLDADASIYHVVAGTWDWEGADGFCKTNPHTITFSADTSVMYLTARVPWSKDDTSRVAVYDLSEHTQNRIRGKIRGETRLDANGRPVVWDLVLTSHDSYRWHQVGWPFFSYTKTVRRCPASRNSGV